MTDRSLIEGMAGDVGGDGRARIAEDAVPCRLLLDDGARRLRSRDEPLHLALRQRAIERIGGRHRADQDQHDQPMPFCPSLEPWKKLTSVQVRMRMPRIHQGGG
jgi:hypothetical protein